VAVVGMACRLPGAPDLAAFRRLLRGGRDAIGPGTGRRAGRRAGGYLGDDVECFDAGFFGVGPVEAAAMDPQQRLLLELAWHALEDARRAPGALRGSPTGVWVGACADDYTWLTRSAGPPGAYTLTGTGRAFLANRISYLLGLHGPSVVVDTGQSSSLVAVHQAVQALRLGECATAIVAGVQLNLAAEADQVVEALGALSPTGRCRTFDAAADGIVRGEGAGVLVLRPLADALRDGDRVYCTVRGSAVTNDGRGDGLTAPSVDAQAAVLERAHRQAGVDPAGVGYVELHGTGTALGDPVEAAALGRVLGGCRAPGAPLWVGSVKTNIGHLEGAAGIVGLIKTACAVHDGELPASLNYREPNPRIDLDRLGLRVCDRPRPWPAGAVAAGVSSFGLGGTNCHVVLGVAPRPPSPRTAARPVPVLVSGRDEAELASAATRLAETLDDGPPVAAIGWSTVTTRTPDRYRAAVCATDPAGLRRGLRTLARDPAAPGDGVLTGRAGGTVAFLFPGQGMQRAGMGRRLYTGFGAFATAFDDACAALEPELGTRVVDAVWGDGVGGGGGDRLDRLDLAQPVLFALEVALYRLLESFGVVPDVVLGHSQGEIAAAHVAGALSLADAATLVVRRGRLIASLPPGGAMVAVQADEAEVRAAVADEPGVVGIAAVNSPRSVVVSGAERAALRVAERFERSGRRTRRLRIAAAGHSPLMEPIAGALREAASGIRPGRGDGPAVVSTLTGRVLDGAELASPEHWARHLCGTVRFAPAVATAHRRGARLFVEVGPGGALTTMVGECPGAGAELRYAPMAGEDEVGGVLGAAAAAAVVGVDVDWAAVAGTDPGRVDLPLTAFRRDRHWLGEQARPAARPTAPARPAWDGDVEGLVLRSTLQVLGGEPDELDTELSFRDLGVDSRMAVELRDQLARATGRALPTTVLFDHPTPAALIDALRVPDPA
jgi:acyl transferase domain-containing protein